MKNAIVITRRGDCNYAPKVKNVQATGAKMALLVNKIYIKITKNLLLIIKK